MKIVYLAWGSLVWSPENLAIAKENPWLYSNLKLPLEYSRISDNKKGRLTLVIDPKNGTLNKVWYSYSLLNNINDSIKSLRLREKTTINNIGFINLKNNKSRYNIYNNNNINYINNIKNWMTIKKIDVAIWTNLSPNWEYSINKAYNYFLNSDLETRLKQLEYIYKATNFNYIKTEFSNYFFEKLR